MPDPLEQLGPSGPFTLGTVQLGMPYGFGDAARGIDEKAATALLDAAGDNGIVWLDTAHAYGDSESRIGRWMDSNRRRFRICTKLPSLADVPDSDVNAFVRPAIETSLERLRVTGIDICLAHGASDFVRSPVVEALRSVLDDGMIGRFGASVYTPEEAGMVLDVADIGALQVPVSAVSSGFADAALIPDAAGRGVLVFARSVFLQGALLMAPEQLPEHLAGLAPVLRRLRELSSKADCPLAALLMAAVLRVPGLFSMVVGVDSSIQLRETADAARQAHAVDPAIVDEAVEASRGLPAGVTDPRRWP